MKKLSRRNIILFLFFITLVSVSGANNPPDEKIQNRPNIIYILADDLGSGDLSCFNAESKISTPNIDKLASQGISFTDAHSGSAVCTPTRYGILTGRYAWRSRLQKAVLWPWDEPLIDKDRTTVPEFLKSKGYNTACIGKWHLGWDWPTKDGTKINDTVAIGEWDSRNRDQFGKKIDFTQKIENGPVTRGFDYYFGDDVPNFAPYCFIENDKTVGLPEEEKPADMFGTPGPMLAGWKLDAVMPTLTKKAVGYIKTNAGSNSDVKKHDPFFLYFALTAPHTPIAPTEEFKNKSRAGAYGDFVQQVDWTVGQVMLALEKSGQAENTLIIFTSDNGSPGRDGTNMGGPPNSVKKYGHNSSYIYRGIKADIWEGGHRVPFIARWPGKIKPDTKSEEVICLTDLFATCAAILTEKLPDNVAEDSYNILPALKSEKYDHPIRKATVHHSINGSFAIRQGKWKLELCPLSGGWSGTIKNAAEQDLPMIQLYDLSKDIGEQKNLQAQYPEVVHRLTNLLKDYVAKGRSTPGKPQQNDAEIDIWKTKHHQLKN